MLNIDFDKGGERIKIVPKYIWIPMVLVVAILQIYFSLTFTGPVEWFATFQASLFNGTYYIFINFGLSLILISIPFVLVFRFVCVPIFERKKEVDEQDILDS